MRIDFGVIKVEFTELTVSVNVTIRNESSTEKLEQLTDQVSALRSKLSTAIEDAGAPAE